ncbi:DUF427 domain-containing protein [Actinacidiphila sp. DG2A-62]|jgi:uncharacterized protein (DUF427 family)|uniref:DUF427 domain-containing protein n=1 Tax=Actinacidiphila sp. DG2A-62 TaxID=3108821 RepID=UPI002DB72A7F|nr:DUF427 domain-containing protein [Actinacidiphila sp. DG2A-62]MEC3998788.1 DUF427 domain-containing protein [Actinacidiphila sp. DG2A-62]
MTRPVKTPGPDHPITVEPTGARVVVRAGDRVIADTTRALSLAESTYPVVQYIPYEDVAEGALRPTDSHTYCPYKGEASYYTLVGPQGETADAVWTYDKPYDAVREIAGHVAFYPQHVDIAVG